MKTYILLSFILIVGCSGYGQYDTTKIIMLACDTSRKYSTRNNGGVYICDTCTGNRLRWKDKTDTLSSYYVGYVFWQYGYEVRKDTFVAAHEVHGTNEGFDRMPYTLIVYDQTYSILIERLDADKKPLPKSIVIWQTINIK